MKKVIIDDYEIYIEDGKMVLGKFKDYEGNEHCFEINEILRGIKNFLKYYKKD